MNPSHFYARLWFYTLAGGVFAAAAGWAWGLFIALVAGWRLARVAAG